MKSKSRLVCPIANDSKGVFFSLVDYRNSYFTSDNPDKIVEFYNSFKDREELIEWMKERPKGTANIYEVDGEKDIIVVIPTADFNGKYAKECRENIFKGLHIIFVESGGKEDFYFNIAHNINIGIKKAMEYSPKWIVVSNDDMYKIDDISLLISQLEKVDNKAIGTCFLRPQTIYYSTPDNVVKIRKTMKMAATLLGFLFPRKIRETLYLMNKFSVNFLTWSLRNRSVTRSNNKVLNKVVLYLYDFFFEETLEFTNIISFGIFSSNALKTLFNEDGYAFDPVFINWDEDSDLSIRLLKSDFRSAWVDFKIGYYLSSSLGLTHGKALRENASRVYFSWKIENQMYKELTQ